MSRGKGTPWRRGGIEMNAQQEKNSATINGRKEG